MKVKGFNVVVMVGAMHDEDEQAGMVQRVSEFTQNNTMGKRTLDY